MNSATGGEDRWPASDTPHRITTTAQAVALAGWLLSGDRRRPLVVISTHPAYDRPFIDPAGVSDEVSGLLPVVVLDAAAAEALAAGIGDPLLAVSHGAARVYPVGPRWRSAPDEGMHLCLGPQQGPAVQAVLIADALSTAHEAGLLAGADPGGDLPLVEAQVAGFSSDYHVMLRCTDDRRAVLHTGRLRLDVPPARLVRRGQAFRGVLTGRGPFWQFLPDLPRWDIAAVVQRAYPSGALVPALVSTVQPSRAEVMLHPDFAVELPGQEVDLTRLLAPGDVVAVEVGWSGTACSVVLGDESRAALAMPVLPGGPPWLLLDRPAPTDPPPPGPLTPALGSDMAALTMQRLARRAAALESEVAILRRHDAAARTQRRAALIEARERSLPQVFADPEQQLRWEIGVTYLEHVAESDRPAAPLREFAVGRAFPTRLDLLQGVARPTVLRAIVDLVTGRLSPASTASNADAASEWQVPVPRRTGPPATLSGRWLPDGRMELRRI